MQQICIVSISRQTDNVGDHLLHGRAPPPPPQPPPQPPRPQQKYTTRQTKRPNPHQTTTNKQPNLTDSQSSQRLSYYHALVHQEERWMYNQLGLI